MKRSQMDRRSLLKAAGLAAVGALVGSARAVRAAEVQAHWPQASSMRKLAKPNVSMQRVIRTTVGLRPYRTGGARVQGTKIDAKTVIHNYGHGSLGITRSWGTANLAVEEAGATGQQRYAVIGCGAVGLATARLLQRRGYDVTIYAKDLPPDTTSNKAGAGWGPIYHARLSDADRFAHRYFQSLVGDYYGVRWVEQYSDPGLRGDLFQYVDLQELAPGVHPFPLSTSVFRYMGLLIEPPIYLNALTRDFQLAGGRIVVREFPDLRSVLALPEPVVVNCSGLGAGSLFGDRSVYPGPGQLMVCLPQPEIDYSAGPVGMLSRKDGLVFGGGDPGNGPWSLEPNEAVVRERMARVVEFFRAMK